MNIFRLIRTTKRALQHSRIARNESGVAAMEFAIIAPMIIGLYLGLAELASVLNVERRVSHSASVAGDLATQVVSLDESEAEDLVSAVLHVANLGTGGNYILRLQSYYRRPNGNVASEGLILYRSGRHGGLKQYDRSSLTEDLLPIGEGIVVAKVKHAYSPFGFKRVGGDDEGEGFLPDSIDLEETFLLKPRRSSTVVIGDAGKHVRFNCRGPANNVSCVRN
ncbi:MAG: TadE/TadG family type IV pilus assembly protein [Litorimonas sp.]